MKLYAFFCSPLIALSLLSACSGSETVQELSENDSLIDATDQTSGDVPLIHECSTSSIADFNQYLGLSYGEEEIILRSKMGKHTSGMYTPDSSEYIFSFNRIDRVPISVWVNAETHKINTVFMEVLSLGEKFEEDLADAVEEFSIVPCESFWFGLTAEEIKAQMGPPDEEAVSSQGITLLSYDSADLYTTVTFKIYDQQDGKCSSVSVNWFYE